MNNQFIKYNKQLEMKTIPGPTPDLPSLYLNGSDIQHTMVTDPACKTSVIAENMDPSPIPTVRCCLHSRPLATQPVCPNGNQK